MTMLRASRLLGKPDSYTADFMLPPMFAECYDIQGINTANLSTATSYSYAAQIEEDSGAVVI